VLRERLEQLSSDLRKVPDPPFDLRLAGTGSFGRGPIARVYWLGIETGVEALVKLAGEVEASCLRAGFERELRPFNPHLTLARSRERRGDVLPELPPPPDLTAWTVTSFRLYRSRLAPGGANYSVLEDFPG
jgi:RNA 2',3'-cyclic 3'-phosphodiesterase